MGVIPCDRAGCDRIMCDLYLFCDEYRICGYCLEELETRWRNKPTPLSEEAVRDFVKEFMNSPGGASEEATPEACVEFKRMLRIYDYRGEPLA